MLQIAMCCYGCKKKCKKKPPPSPSDKSGYLFQIKKSLKLLKSFFPEPMLYRQGQTFLSVYKAPLARQRNGLSAFEPSVLVHLPTAKKC